MRECFDFTFKMYVKADHCSQSYHHLHYRKGFLLLPLPSAVHYLHTNQNDPIKIQIRDIQFSSVAQSCLTLCDPMPITKSWSPLKPMSIESVMPSNYLILCCPLLLLPSIFPSIRVFSNELALRIRWPKYWNFSINISHSNEHPGLISFRMDWLDLLVVREILSVQIPPVTFPSQRPWAEMAAWEWKPIPYKPIHHLLTLTTLTPDTLESLFLKYTKHSVSSGLFMLFLLVDLHGSLFTSFRSLYKSPLLSEPFLSKI